MKVVIVDDHSVVRLGLRSVLESAGDVEVSADFASPEAALPWLRTHSVDLVLMDMRFRSQTKTAMDGVAAVRAIKKQDGPPVVVVTAHGSEPEILSALAAGAIGYVLKDADPEELMAAVRAGAAGQTFLGSQVEDRVKHNPGTLALTEREYDVLRLVAKGSTNVRIAQELFLSEATVKTHLNRIFDKLGTRTRTAAVAEARTRGLLEE